MLLSFFVAFISSTHLPATPITTKMHAHMAANIVAEFGYSIEVMLLAF